MTQSEQVGINADSHAWGAIFAAKSPYFNQRCAACRDAVHAPGAAGRLFGAPLTQYELSVFVYREKLS